MLKEKVVYWNWVVICYSLLYPQRLRPDINCFLCGVYTNTKTYPCRVCLRSFHDACLQKFGKLDPVSRTLMVNQAEALEGWSCFNCVSRTWFLLKPFNKYFSNTFQFWPRLEQGMVNVFNFFFQTRLFWDPACWNSYIFNTSRTSHWVDIFSQ